MKVLILANNDAGLYKFRKELMEELVKPGSYLKDRIDESCEVVASLPYGDFVPDIIKLGVKFVDTNVNRRGVNPIADLKLLFKYIKIIKEEKPDIVFTYTIKPNVYGGIASSVCGVPYVANVTGLGTAVENGGILQKITLALYRIGLYKAKKVFFQNSANRDFMKEHGVIHGSYDLLPGSGVNLSQYELLEYPQGDTIDFMFISRVMKEKGIDQYLEAAEYIRKKYPNTRFHICGFCEQDYEERLKELQEKGIIIYHGLVKDIAAMHKISSCTIHPTYYPEGLSNVLLESCACGRPIITTNRPGCREIVDDGVNGFVVEEKNKKSLIDAILGLLELCFEKRKSMGINGRRKVESYFNRNIVIEKYIKEL